MECTSTTCAYGRTCVQSSGPPQADIMVVCGQPGFREVQTGVPLVGAAGQLFDTLITACGLTRHALYLAQTVGCVDSDREDKRPLPDEMDACQPRLLTQVEQANPKLIIAMGGLAQQLWFPGTKVGQIHGKFRMWQGRVVMPTYDTFAALPFKSPQLQPTIIADVMSALAVIA